MNKIPIAEIFCSIQGEGKSTGKPSVFVRVWGCNLFCRFKGVDCDTPYAVYTERDKAKLMTVNEVILEIVKYNCKHIVWTGGEPTLYQDFIIDVMSRLKKMKYTSEVETNGTNVIKKKLSSVVNQFNVSLKLKSSNQKNDIFDKKRINQLALNFFNPKKSYFKFVINGEDDLKEIKQLNKLYPNFEIWLMPEGFKREDIIKHSETVAKLCIENNWHFSPREHIIIWDYKRGV